LNFSACHHWKLLHVGLHVLHETQVTPAQQHACLLQTAFELGCQSHDRNAQQLLCACVGLHAFMLSLAERIEHLHNESEC
jgi:hypothetical protein